MGIGAEECSVAILANPIAGTRSSRKSLNELIEVLRVTGLNPFLCQRPEDLSDIIAQQGENIRCVIAAGGDGTLREVLNRLGNTPVSIFPLGNENLVARHFGFRKSSRQTSEAVRAGNTRPLDLGLANGRVFAFMVGVGFDAEVVHSVHQHRKGHVNKFTYALAIRRAWHGYQFPEIDVEIMETAERLRGAMVMLFNLPVYGLGLPIAVQADPADGRLDLYVFQRPGRWELIRYVCAVILGMHLSLKDVQRRQIQRVRFWSKDKVPIQIDGDPAGYLPMEVEAVQGRWRLIVPRSQE